MERQDAIEDGIDRLAMGERVFDEADVPVRSGGVQAKMRNCVEGKLHKL
jgi:hypothetical protein